MPSQEDIEEQKELLRCHSLDTPTKVSARENEQIIYRPEHIVILADDHEAMNCCIVRDAPERVKQRCGF